MIKQVVVALVAAFIVGGVTLEPAEAAPTACNWTSARARKDAGPASSPTLCAVSVCRQVGWWTYKIDGAVASPGMPAPMLIKYHIEAGTWAGLPACPSWTNTSMWFQP